MAKSESWNVFARASAEERSRMPKAAQTKWYWQASFCTEICAGAYVSHFEPRHTWEWRITRSDKPKTHLS
jgi:hypothetical protein